MHNAPSIAVVGMGCAFPDASDLNTFWQNILQTRYAARTPPPNRWIVPIDTVYDPEPGTLDRVYSRQACFVDHESLPLNIKETGIPEDVLEQLDPMFHILLYAGQQAMADAKLGEVEPARAGVIIGNIALPTTAASRIAWDVIGRTFEEQVTGIRSVVEESVHPLNRFVAGLPAAILAQALGFHGGAYALDAACASSLYAVKLAVDELMSGRTDVMVSGGVSRPDSLYTQMGFSQLRALSPRGISAPFDAGADGLVVGEGAGILVLKRLEDAERDGNTIHAVIRGIGLSNDVGGRLLAPTSEGQMRAMTAAYKQAGWHPGDVNLIECHATGTPVGDAVEIESLNLLWHDIDTRSNRYVVGSVKSNVGHLLTAAGSAALIKTILAIKHKTLPPTANFKKSAPGLADKAFHVLTKAEPWPDNGDTQRAAVSAFGFGGINAHVLLESYHPASSRNSVTFPERKIAVAVVGMSARFGPCENLRAVQEAMLEGMSTKPDQPDHWWGIRQNRYGRTPTGFPIQELRIPHKRYRIPPRELEEMLPQQILMLETAIEAWHDAGFTSDAGPHTGVFIGVGLDLNTTNYHLRWMIEACYKEWARQLDMHLDPEALQTWLDALRDACMPPLTANRTMGGLASVAASRIARELRCGGPSFTVSSEDTSGFHALYTAVQMLEQGEIDIALAGAVDFAGDPRALLMRADLLDSCDLPYSDGAAAFILKRLDDAQRDGDRIYFVIQDMARTSNKISSFTAGKCAPADYAVSLHKENIDPASVGLVELQITGQKDQDTAAAGTLFKECAGGKTKPAWGSAACHIGQSGAATSMLSMLRAGISLYQQVLPAQNSACFDTQSLLPENEPVQSLSKPAFWLHNRIDGPRRALISMTGIEGTNAYALFEEPPGNVPSTVSRTQPLSARREGLFLLHGNTVEEIVQALDRLRHKAETVRVPTIEALARLWYADTISEKGARTAAIVARGVSELLEQTAFARTALEQNPDRPWHAAERHGPGSPLYDRVFYSPEPLLKKGDIAFVFPGSGNHYADMGRDLLVQWPEVLREQDLENLRLRSQYQPEVFWFAPHIDDASHQTLIFGQVALGTAISDLVQKMNIEPAAVLGYSLGETAGLFALHAWEDRDEMLARIEASDLFTRDLAGDCDAARKRWRLGPNEAVDWVLGVIDRPMETARTALRNTRKVYPLIANTLHETVVGGNRNAVERLINDLKCRFIPLQGVTTVHCEVVKEVEQEYHDLHLFTTTPPKGVRFYSGAWGQAYEVTRENAADSILAQALHGVDFPKVVDAAYNDGARFFLEIGPGNSCTRMLSRILAGRQHAVRSLCYDGADAVSLFLRGMAHLAAEGAPVNLHALYAHKSRAPGHQIQDMKREEACVHVRTGGDPFRPPELLKQVQQETCDEQAIEEMEDYGTDALSYTPRLSTISGAPHESSFLPEADRAITATADAHEAFLDFSQTIQEAMFARNHTAIQQSATHKESAAITLLDEPPRTLNREQCMEFAIGKIGNVLGARYAPIDAHPTRVRLPDEPLMLVDRITEIEGEPLSMQPGRLVTEHDVLQNGWYLDGGRIPTSIAIEAGQADLFLSAWLGMDFQTRGLAMYRLLDAEVTFYRGLPAPGDIIRYEIHIDHFFRHGNPWFFHFCFEGSVNGQPLLTMRNGCAGFFTQDELDAGRGIMPGRLESMDTGSGGIPPNVCFVPMSPTSYTDEALSALRNGDMAACFGETFARIQLRQPLTLPDGRLHLVDRVLSLQPNGGKYKCGSIIAEADVQPDAWFLTCHFCDDRVMPGTLMYECCLHTLRIFLMRLGWVGEADACVWEPVPEVAGRLRCRGQVLETTKRVRYEVDIKEFGFRPEPYAIADARMYADDKHIVDIFNMSVRLSGQTETGLRNLWQHHDQAQHVPELFSEEQVLAFATGNPSKAFGDKYKPFDDDRFIARLPGPPYSFISSVTQIDATPWVMQKDASAVLQYNIPADAWYFTANRQETMPFAVLLEVALQSCGWLAAYMGSALYSDEDLHFRNLGGTAIQHRPVRCDTGRLSTFVKATQISQSAGMIIQNYTMHVSDPDGPVYTGETHFGFFSEKALAAQVGLRNAQIYTPDDEEQQPVNSFEYPQEAPYPDTMLRMIDTVASLIPDAGPKQLGYIRGAKQVRPEEWFFKAHFYRDPVWPGSLGLEAFLQLLKILAADRWGVKADCSFETPQCGTAHTWVYRGQVTPASREVDVRAVVTKVDDTSQALYADGFLLVDGLPIYSMNDFTIQLRK